MTYAIIAFRNIIKRPRQTLILLMAIAVGLFAILFFQATIDGFYQKMIENVVDASLGHLQVNRKQFRQRKDAKFFIPGGEKVIKAIESTPHVTACSPRVLAQGLISSPETSYFTTICGVDYRMESAVTVNARNIIKGNPVMREDHDGILLGKAMADKLKVDVGDKVVIMARNVSGEMEGSALRVRGVFKASLEGLEKTYVYVSIDTARKILGIGQGLHQVAVRIDDPRLADDTVSLLKKKLQDPLLAVETWAEIEPVLWQQIQMSSVSSWIMFSIVFAALAFGIVNSFLMEIFERIREFGVMLSLGTPRAGVFFTILWESAFLGVAGCVLGVLLSLLVMGVIMGGRMDLANFARGLEYFGFGSVLPLEIKPGGLARSLLATMATVMLASVYPAARASLFKPVEAMRYV